MSTIAVNAITDASGGNTASINGATPTTDNLMGRNLIINGAMQIWQRGTSSSSGGYQTVDRFYHYGSNGLTHIRSTDVPTGQGFTYSLGTTGTPSGEFNVGQSIELPADGEPGVFFNGQTITISYWAKSSVAGDKLWNGLFFRDSHGSSSNQAIVDFDNTNNSELTTSWARYTKTYTIGVSPNSTNKALSLQIRSRNYAEDSSTPSGNIYITGVQLETGSVATSFERRHYGQELALAQRYFNTAGITLYPLPRYNNSSGAGLNRLAISPPMRAAPTVTDSGGWTSTAGYAGQPTYSNVTVSSLVIGSAVSISANAIVYANNGTIYFSAEL